MSGEREAIEAARARLAALLGELSLGVAEVSLERCPYRTRDDVCTFGGECQNRMRENRRPPHCMGAQLDRRPAFSRGDQ